MLEDSAMAEVEEAFTVVRGATVERIEVGRREVVMRVDAITFKGGAVSDKGLNPLVPALLFSVTQPPVSPEKGVV